MPTVRGLGRLSAWDLVPAALVGLLAPVITAGIAESEGAPYDLLGVALIVATGAALLGAPGRPAATLLVVTGLLSVYLWSGYPYGPVMLAFVVALVGVALRLPLRRSAPPAALAILVMASHAFAPAGPGDDGDLAGRPYRGFGPGGQEISPWLQSGFVIGWAALVFAVAVAIGLRRQARSQERHDQVRALVDAERLRMSHDVHDGVGHGLAAINLQASLALRSLRSNPERAEEAVRAIRESSAAALAELRSVLARMEPGDPPQMRRPGTGLAAVPDLAGRLEQAGLTVLIDGPVDIVLPGPVDVAAYRVVQESLTNALRHGTGGSAQVVLRWREGAVTVLVRNPCRTTPQPSSTGGRGIPGMRARVEAVGGTLSAGRVGDDFEVRAGLPTHEEKS